MRRVLTVAAALGLMMVVVVPGGLADAISRDGRSADANPGAASESSKPLPADDGGGRDNAKVAPFAAIQPAASSSASSAENAAIVDNGRGGPDPAVSPNQILTIPNASAVVAEVPEVDTDSGLPPAPASVVFGSVLSVEEGPSDQDVPGAATPSAPGDDAPANDSDG